ncbi:MAG: hypothetical protein F6K31_07045 [Symploca sp. SIO2G7]|nr:hypothetical protein [Symploca sp. SIO2G7]
MSTPIYSHLAPVHKYLIRSVTTINSNAEIVKSYGCCLLPVACCLPSQVSFRLGARSKYMAFEHSPKPYIWK